MKDELGIAKLGGFLVVDAVASGGGSAVDLAGSDAGIVGRILDGIAELGKVPSCGVVGKDVAGPI